MKKIKAFLLLLAAVNIISAQQYRIPVSEVHETMQTGKYQPTWESLQTHQTPEWFQIGRAHV